MKRSCGERPCFGRISEMVENEERKQTKGKDLKMGGGKNRVCGGGPSFGRTLEMGDNYNRRFSLQI
jgi:hypothetical protein